MARLNLFERTAGSTEFEYDAEADTLYVSFGPPRPAVGIDVGEGMIARFDQAIGKVVGVTIVGIGGRIEKKLGEGTKNAPAS